MHAQVKIKTTIHRDIHNFGLDDDLGKHFTLHVHVFHIGKNKKIKKLLLLFFFDLGKLFALHVHVLHIDLHPRRCLPFVDGSSG